MINSELIENFLKFLNLAHDFDIRIVNDEESINQLVDFFIDISAEEETDTDILNWLFEFDRITWSTVWLDRKEYNEIITEWYSREYIDQSQFITNMINKETNQMIIVELIRVKKKGSHKTVEELQNDLDKAVNAEDYNTAAKLQKKISNKLKKQHKKHESDSN